MALVFQSFLLEAAKLFLHLWPSLESSAPMGGLPDTEKLDEGDRDLPSRSSFQSVFQSSANPLMALAMGREKLGIEVGLPIWLPFPEMAALTMLQ